MISSSTETVGSVPEVIIPRLTEHFQILAALNSTGAGFEARGGSSLMLTEPVENSVDSIIEAVRQHVVNKGTIRIFLDQANEQVVIIDNGLGFSNPRHICERPFDSLKKYDPELTGKFARGLQGFRSYCSELTFITRRSSVPVKEAFSGKSGNTVKLEFRADSIEVRASIIQDEEFKTWSWGDFDHGAVAFYTVWKKGEFAKIRKDKLVKRIEKHFGELIRKGEIEILLWEGTDLKPGVRIDASKFDECRPRDYSKFTRINIPSVPYVGNGGKKGEVIFELFLTSGPRSDRDVRPFLMYKDRPVGDGSIAEVEEFADTDVWISYYLTGFVRADFCQINELRLALKPGPEREFLYQQLDAIEPLLRAEIKKHHNGLIDIKRSQEINALVNKLQDFLKNKNIFDFKFAKELGHLNSGERPELEVSLTARGTEDSAASISTSGEPVENLVPTIVTNQPGVVPGHDQNVHPPQDQVGGVGDSEAQSRKGGPGGSGEVQPPGKDGYSDSAEGLKKMQTTQQTVSTGNIATPTSKSIRKRKPRGFNIDTQEDEFSDQLSFFDPVTSTVVINSGHERYRKREDPTVPVSKELLNYMSELYIFEICKLAKLKNADLDLDDLFLKTKYEFFEVT